MLSVLRTAITFFVVAMMAASLSAYAATEQAFSAQAFKAAQDAGKPILVEIHAD